MRFEVPQFIEVDDKIFGPLTWRQFLYLGGGVGMSVVMFLIFPLVFFVLFGIPLALLAGALAFYQVNNRPFSFFLESIINYIRKQHIYFWKQSSDVVYKRDEAVGKNVKRTPSFATPTSVSMNRSEKKKNIASLSRKLELQALQKSE